MTKLYVKVIGGERHGPFLSHDPFFLDHLPRIGDILHALGTDYGRVESVSWFYDDGFARPPTTVVILTSLAPRPIIQEEDYEPDFDPELD